MNEIWKRSNLNPEYVISSIGNVRRFAGRRKNAIYKNRRFVKEKAGYLIARLNKGSVSTNYRVHCLVADAFIGPRPENHDVNHKNFDRTDNRIENLEYMTRKQNIGHSLKHGRIARGENKGKLTNSSVLEIRRLHHTGMLQNKIATMFKLTPSGVGKIVHRTIWTHI